MLKRLQNKWGVGPFQLVLILITFAIGGSLSGYGAKWVMGLLAWKKSVGWWGIYILIVTLLWPLCVLSVSVIFGQLSFFKRYLSMLGKRILKRKP